MAVRRCCGTTLDQAHEHWCLFPVAETGPAPGVPEPPDQRGLFQKFRVTRTDLSDLPGGKHDGCDYFVLDLTHDRHALEALAAYARSCQAEHPALAADLLAKVSGAAS